MKKELKKRIKRNYKLVLGIIIGVIISGVGAYAATTISSSNISYDNSKSGLTSTNLKGAIDELYEKSDIRKQGKYVSAYTYSTATSTKCITGEESTCKKTECYKTKTANSCKAGDIIKYKVNDTDIVTFHVMFDNGSTITMQSQKNTISSIPWINKSDYLEAGGSEVYFGTQGYNDKGPLTALKSLENTTKEWINVNDQTYTMGTTVFKTNKYTGCNCDKNYVVSCTRNDYTLPERTAKARMITVQEAVSLGCYNANNSCPIWMGNYLYYSTGIVGTANLGDNEAYWTMNSSLYNYGYRLRQTSALSNTSCVNETNKGVRAVVVVSK